MKIVQMVTQMEAGGAQKVAYLLHNAFLRRGYDSELWFLYLKRPAYSGKAGVRVLCQCRPSMLRRFALLEKIFAWIRADRPDVVITHTHYANVIGHAVSVLAGTKVRVAVHQNPLETYPTLVRHVDWIFGTLGLYTAQVAVSRTVIDSMAAYPTRYRRLVHCVYNGLAVEEHAAGPHRTHLAALPAWGPIILHVGRFSRQKNHEALLQMMLQLPSANLVLVGDGELRSEIELLAQQMKLEKRVHFFGEISPEAVRAVMRACDLMVFPSSYEAMPMALLEAMAAGMAIVASDIPAHRELLADCGVIARADPSSLAEAATRLLADRDAAAGFARKAIERARQFTIEASADGYERVFGARPSFSTSGASAEPGSRFPGYRLAGMRVHAITRHELVEIAVEAVHKEKRCVIANQNLHGLYCWFQERKVREFQRSADYTHIDGMSLVLLGWMLGLPLRRDHRTGYMDLLPPLAREAAARHWRVFYLGSKLGVAEKAAVELRKQYPGLQVRTHHGHFDTRMSGRENQEVLAEINAYAPNVLLVGMGMPRQEMWILENRNQISANVVFCCGALMDYVAGEIPTPPRWVGPLGLEWLLRLLSEPGRLWYRYLVEPWFVFSQIARYYLRNPGKRHGREQQQ